MDLTSIVFHAVYIVIELLRNNAIDERPARKPAGAATDSGWFVFNAPRKRQLIS